jgi:hypothetical protein
LRVPLRRCPLVAIALLTLGCEATIGTPRDEVMDAGLDAVTPDGATDAVTAEVAPCAPCSVWQVRCGDRCVDLTVSPENCGACGVRCDARTQVCRSGVCAATAGRCAPVVVAATDGGASAAGLRAEYYATPSLTGLRRVRVDPTVDFDWTMTAPGEGVTATAFSARWRATVRPLYSERYTFITSSDDGVRLWVDDRLLIDNWTSHGATEDQGTIELVAYQPYRLRLEYYNGAGAGSTRLLWTSARQMREVVPARALTPGAGVDYGCDNGACCDAGGSTPVCCPASTRCVNNARFNGCCPVDETCGEAPVCIPPG